MPKKQIALSKHTPLSNNLNRLMTEKNIDTAILSQKTNIAVTTINALRRGVGNPTLDTITTLARFFKLSISELAENTIKERAKNHVRHIPLLSFKTLPQYLRSKKYIDTALMPSDAYLDETCFAITLDNNALHPFFEKGSVFIISPTEDAMDGDMVLVKFNEDNYCLRRAYLESDYYFFKPIATTLRSHESHSQQYKIIGVVLKAIQHFHA